MALPNSDPRRSAELALIHLAKKGLAIDEDTYRTMLRNVAGVESAGELDAVGRRKVIEHLRERGFKPVSKGRTRPAAGREPMVKKIRALLIEGGRKDAYADGIAKRMFQVDRFEWCTPEQLRKIIAALSYDKKRRSRS